MKMKVTNWFNLVLGVIMIVEFATFSTLNNFSFMGIIILLLGMLNIFIGFDGIRVVIDIFNKEDKKDKGLDEYINK